VFTTKNPLKLSFIGFCASIFATSSIATFTNSSVVLAQKTVRPTTAKVTQLTNGDLACYIGLVDNKGKSYEIPSSFSFCMKQKAYLNKRVRLTYGKMKIADCQSAEPCGKSRFVTAITRMQVIK
jgi:hypothetical protein